MKTIVTVPTRNERWVLPTTLPPMLQIADEVVVADQHSKDGTREFLSEFENVHVIDNNNEGHSNEVRWLLLDHVRSTWGSDNLVLCIDADEILPPKLFNKNKEILLENIGPGNIISSPWIQMWKSKDHFRDDASVWNPRRNKKPFMFLDNGKMDYHRESVINDHTTRVPDRYATDVLEIKIPLLHFQFACWDRSQIKQAWYGFCEILQGASIENTNRKYAPSVVDSGAIVKKSYDVWLDGVNLSDFPEGCDITKTWYFEEIMQIIGTHGRERFHGLFPWALPPLYPLKRLYYK